MVQMIATKTQTYDRRTIQAGEEFEVADQYVGTLVSLGRARPKDDRTGTKVEPVKTQPEAAPEGDVAKGKYKTRRLKSDDEAA